MPNRHRPPMVTPALLALALLVTAVLAGCPAAPRSLAPVTGNGAVTGQSLEDAPADAVLAARAMLARIRGESVPGVEFTASAAVSPDAHDYAYPGFDVAGLRLQRYMEWDGGGNAPGRDVNGVLALADQYGRRAELLFRLAYTLDGDVLTVRDCTVGPLFAASPRIRVFAVPKGRLPGPAPDWAATYRAVRAVDDTPEGGVTDAALLDSHDLVLFVMDRTDPAGDVALRLDLGNLQGLDPTVRLDAREWVDYDGWRVAVVSVVRGQKT